MDLNYSDDMFLRFTLILNKFLFSNFKFFKPQEVALMDGFVGWSVGWSVGRSVRMSSKNF